MIFSDFIEAVSTDIRTLGCDVVPIVQDDFAIWTAGLISVEVRLAGDTVLVRLRTPGASVAPVDYPMSVRGVRDAALSISAALDVPTGDEAQ